MFVTPSPSGSASGTISSMSSPYFDFAQAENKTPKRADRERFRPTFALRVLEVVCPYPSQRMKLQPSAGVAVRSRLSPNLMLSDSGSPVTVPFPLIFNSTLKIFGENFASKETSFSRETRRVSSA